MLKPKPHTKAYTLLYAYRQACRYIDTTHLYMETSYDRVLENIIKSICALHQIQSQTSSDKKWSREN